MATKKVMTSLEERLASLEEITSKLENGQLPIDEAITAYSKGMEVALSCRKTLDEMTQKIALAKKNAQLAMASTQQSQSESLDTEDSLSPSRADSLLRDNTVSDEFSDSADGENYPF